MILYYCMGGGLGHITRYSKFVKHLDELPVVLTNCELVKTGAIRLNALKVESPNPLVTLNAINLSLWVKEMIKQYKPDRLIVDSFPAGILGELCLIDKKEFDDVKLEYIARILKIPQYRKRLQSTLPKYNIVYKTEKITDEHQHFIDEMESNVVKLELNYDLQKNTFDDFNENRWVVIHSNTGNELQQLYELAIDTALLQKKSPELIVISPGSRPEFLAKSVIHKDLYPADAILYSSGKVISAAGFNMMHQMKKIQHRHIVLPMQRPLDDQFFRCKSMIK